MVTGRLEAFQGSRVAYSVFPTDLPSDDKHNMQLNPKYIPRPTVNNRLGFAFHLPIGVNIAYDANFFLATCAVPHGSFTASVSSSTAKSSCLSWLTNSE